MADQKLTALTALVAPTADDLLYVVDDPGGTPVERKTTIGAVLALAGGGGVAVLDSSRPNINVSNTTTETSVYSVTIPAGTLSTNKHVRLVLTGSLLKNGGGVDGFTFRFKFGGSTIITMTKAAVAADDTERRPLLIELWLCGDGATNAQIMQVRMEAVRDALTSGAGATIGIIIGRAAAAIDSTVNQTLEITEQMSAMTPLHQYTSEHGLTLAP